MKKQLVGITLFAILILSSCIYENREDLVTQPQVVSFSADVEPIIQSQCTSCHNRPSPSGSTPLENYDDLKAIGTDGRLINVLKAENGFGIMPQTGSLPADQITLIETWVNDGMPNN